MASKLNRHAYEQLIREDLDWLLAQGRTLERDHIELIVRGSAEHEYAADSEKLPSEDITEAYQRILTLTKALEQCVRVAQMWHGDDAFDIYFNHSPEMKLIRDAIGKMPDPTEA